MPTTKSGRTKGNNTNENRNERARVKREALAMRKEFHAMPCPELEDPDAVAERCGLFFESCERRGLIPTLGGLAMAMRVPTTFLKAVAAGERPGWRGHKFTSESAMELVMNLLEVEQVWQTTFENDGYVNPTAPIFASKNMYGWKDTQETHVVNVSAKTTLAEIQAKYQGAIPSHLGVHGEECAVFQAGSARRATNRAIQLESSIEDGAFEGSRRAYKKRKREREAQAQDSETPSN